MARIAFTVRTPWPAERAFEFTADFRNLVTWDPGATSSEMVAGEEPGLGTAYDVHVSGTELRYETIEFDPPARTVLEAKSRFLRSYDVIDITPIEGGCEVTYDATLELNGVLKIGDAILRPFFNRIGNKAAAGMEQALEGTRLR